MKTTRTIRQEIENFLQGKKLERISLRSRDSDRERLGWATTDYDIYFDSDAGKYLYETNNDAVIKTQDHVVFRVAADIAKALTYKAVETMFVTIITDTDSVIFDY